MSNRSIVLACALGLVVLGVVLYLRPRPNVSPKERPAEENLEPLRDDERATTPRIETAQPPAQRGAPPEPAERHLDPEQREQLRALIWQGIGRASPPPAAPVKRRTQYVLPEHPPWEDAPRPADDASGPANGHIDPKYIQERVREDFFPLARSCFTDGLAQNPKLAGTVHFAFNIVGDEKTGGIVETVDVLNKSTLRDPDVIDCMRQSFLSITFPPPANGGEVTVIYPIVFSNEDGG
jgi:hypothetical protein